MKKVGSKNADEQQQDKAAAIRYAMQQTARAARGDIVLFGEAASASSNVTLLAQGQLASLASLSDRHFGVGRAESMFRVGDQHLVALTPQPLPPSTGAMGPSVAQRFWHEASKMVLSGAGYVINSTVQTANAASSAAPFHESLEGTSQEKKMPSLQCRDGVVYVEVPPDVRAKLTAAQADSSTVKGCPYSRVYDKVVTSASWEAVGCLEKFALKFSEENVDEIQRYMDATHEEALELRLSAPFSLRLVLAKGEVFLPQENVATEEHKCATRFSDCFSSDHFLGLFPREETIFSPSRDKWAYEREIVNKFQLDGLPVLHFKQTPHRSTLLYVEDYGTTLDKADLKKLAEQCHGVPRDKAEQYFADLIPRQVVKTLMRANLWGMYHLNVVPKNIAIACRDKKPPTITLINLNNTLDWSEESWNNNFGPIQGDPMFQVAQKVYVGRQARQVIDLINRLSQSQTPEQQKSLDALNKLKYPSLDDIERFLDPKTTP